MNRFCVLAGMLAVSALAADTPLPDLLKTVEQRYNRTDTLQVAFRLDFSRTGHADHPETGTLYLRKPGKMRWEYTDPKGKLAVCDGKTYWTYYSPDRPIEKNPLKDADDAPLGFLLGKLHFDKEFKNIQGKPEGADTRITADPKTDNQWFTGIEFLVTSDGRIHSVKVIRYDNTVMNYTFDQEKLGLNLADKLFHFDVPKGADVVEGGK